MQTVCLSETCYVAEDCRCIGTCIRSAVCLATGPQPLPKRLCHRVRSSSSSFDLQCILFSLRPSSSFLRLLPRRTVTSILPSTFSSITCFRRKFLRKIYACLYMDGGYLIVFSSLLSCNVPENWYSRLQEHTEQSVGVNILVGRYDRPYCL